jgi:hypothetical protein
VRAKANKRLLEQKAIDDAASEATRQAAANAVAARLLPNIQDRATYDKYKAMVLRHLNSLPPSGASLNKALEDIAATDTGSGWTDHDAHLEFIQLATALMEREGLVGFFVRVLNVRDACVRGL